MPDDRKASDDKSVGAAWAAPLVRLDAAWQSLEARMCAAILVAEVASLTLWILLRGLATDYMPGGNAAGLVCRAFFGAGALPTAAHLATRSRGVKADQTAVTIAVVVRLFGGTALAHMGVHFASDLFDWLQQPS